jgi:hypothetical protein
LGHEEVLLSNPLSKLRPPVSDYRQLEPVPLDDAVAMLATRGKDDHGSRDKSIIRPL